VETDELWDGDEPAESARYVDGAWGRTANPNTADGELQNIAAFGTGLTRLKGPRRTAALVVVWLILFRDTKADGTAVASLVDIARRGGIDPRTASRAVGRLSRRQMLRVVSRGGLNRGPSAYSVFPYPME